MFNVFVFLIFPPAPLFPPVCLFSTLEYFKKNFLKTFTNKSWHSSLIFFSFFSDRFDWFTMVKRDFENQNFAIFEETVENIGRSDDDMI